MAKHGPAPIGVPAHAAELARWNLSAERAWRKNQAGEIPPPCISCGGETHGWRSCVCGEPHGVCVNGCAAGG
jgi:hypothetical protein